MKTIWQDIRYGFRLLVRSPGFTVVAVVSLALSIGALTAIFSAVNSVVFNPLPQTQPAQLVCIRSCNLERGYAAVGVNPQAWEELRTKSELFAEIVAYKYEYLNWKGEDFLERTDGCWVTPNFFAFWNILPVMGRTFSENEGGADAAPVIILSHRFWQTRLGGDQDVIGRPVELGGRVFTTIGVIPPHFGFPKHVDFWLPFDGPDIEARNNEVYYAMRDCGVIGRLRPGVARRQVQVMLDIVAQRQKQANPRRNRDWVLEIRPLRRMFTTEKIERTLWSLFSVVTFVLVIAMANVTNLLLSRAEIRRQEMTIRMVVGASRGRIVRQVLTESTLVALLGGLVGLGVCYLGVKLLGMYRSSWNVPIVRSIQIDRSMLGFTFILSVLVGLLLGLVPAWQASMAGLGERLKRTSVTVSASRRSVFLSGALVVCELALATVVLVGAALMINSVARLLHVDVGFDTRNLLRVRLDLPGEKCLDLHVKNQMLYRIHERLAVLPGIKSIGAHACQETGMYANERHKEAIEVYCAGVSMGIHDAFQVMGVPLLAGRVFEARDVDVSNRNVIVNESLARLFWPGENALGKTLWHFSSGDETRLRTSWDVIGVVGDFRDTQLDREVAPTLYRPFEDFQLSLTHFLLIRIEGDPMVCIPMLRRELKALEPMLRMPQFEMMERVFYDSTANHRIYMEYLTGMGLVGLALALVGIYGVLSCSVARRTKEIGIRIALGARPREVLVNIVFQGGQLVLMGIGLGLMISLVLTQFIHSYLFGVTPLDGMTFLAVIALLLVLGLLASFIPARKAAKIDPMEALRCE